MEAEQAAVSYVHALVVQGFHVSVATKLKPSRGSGKRFLGKTSDRGGAVATRWSEP